MSDEKKQTPNYATKDEDHWRTFSARVSGMLGAADLGDLGCPDRHVVIAGYRQDRVPSKKNPDGDIKLTLVLHNSEGKPAFADGAGKELRWPINSTNGKMIEKLLGTGKPRKWIGRVITLYTDRFEDRMAGKGADGKLGMTHGIRVRPTLPEHDAKLRSKAKVADATQVPPAAAPQGKQTKSAPAASRPPIDTQNDASQTYVDEPPDDFLAPDATAMPSV